MGISMADDMSPTLNNALRPYEAPVLTKIGAFEEVTQATLIGTHLDKNYPVGTPIPGPVLS
jgi:hypothetical protein